MSIAPYVVAGLWWISAFWRLSSALWGDQRRRALWGVYVAFAAIWTLKTPAVDYGMDHSGINDLSSVVKHVIAIGGMTFLLAYILAMYGSHDESSEERYVRVSRAVSKVALKAAVVVIVLLVLLFAFAIDRSKPTEHFVTGHAGELGMTAYMSLVYLYMGGAAAVAAYQWGSAVRRTTSVLMRVALGMMCASMGLAILYALIRTAYVIYVTAAVPTTHIADLQESITEPLQTVLFLLLLLGLTVPATRALVDHVRAFTALIRIHPLWSDLALAVPAPVMLKPAQFRLGPLSRPVNYLRDIFRLDQPVKDRLARYVTEIRDITAELQYFAPNDLFDRAKEYAQQHAAAAATTEDIAARAEAYWTSAALAHKTRSDSPRSTQAEFTSASGGDYDSEVPWLQKVATHYRTADSATKELVADKKTATA